MNFILRTDSSRFDKNLNATGMQWHFRQQFFSNFLSALCVCLFPAATLQYTKPGPRRNAFQWLSQFSQQWARPYLPTSAKAAVAAWEQICEARLLNLAESLKPEKQINVYCLKLDAQQVWKEIYCKKKQVKVAVLFLQRKKGGWCLERRTLQGWVKSLSPNKTFVLKTASFHLSLVQIVKLQYSTLK